MGARWKMVIADERVKKLIENNLDYAELLLVPKDTDLLLIDKDGGLGNIDKRQQAQVNSWLNSLHLTQQFTKPVKLLVALIKDENEEIQKIPINPTLYTQAQIKDGIDKKKLAYVTYEMPRYPHNQFNLKSKISSLLLTSASVEGFRAILQHSSIIKQKQDSTLQEINPMKNNKRGKNKQ